MFDIVYSSAAAFSGYEPYFTVADYKSIYNNFLTVTRILILTTFSKLDYRYISAEIHSKLVEYGI